MRQRSGLRSYSGSWMLPPASSVVDWNSTMVLVTSSTMTFTGWMFPNVSSSNCPWLYECLHGLAPKYLTELCVPVADVAGPHELHSASGWLLNFPRYNVQTMVDVRSVSPVLMSRTHFLSISGNQHYVTSVKHFMCSLKTFLLQQISHLAY